MKTKLYFLLLHLGTDTVMIHQQDTKVIVSSKKSRHCRLIRALLKIETEKQKMVSFAGIGWEFWPDIVSSNNTPGDCKFKNSQPGMLAIEEGR